MRSRASVRFEPYFKVQFWLPRERAWKDVQRQHCSEQEARAAFLPGKECRVMRVAMDGRLPLP